MSDTPYDLVLYQGEHATFEGQAVGSGGGSAIAPARTVTGTPTQDGLLVNQFATNGSAVSIGIDGDAHAQTQINPGSVYLGDGNAPPSTYNADLYFDSADGLATDGYINCAKGVIVPSADPHIAGAIWNNSGTLAISAG